MFTGIVYKFAMFTGKLVLDSLFNKNAGVQISNFMKKLLQHRCFPVNIVKI